MGFLDRFRKPEERQRIEREEHEKTERDYKEASTRKEQFKKRFQELPGGKSTIEHLEKRAKEHEEIENIRNKAMEERKLIIIKREARAEAEREYARKPLSKGVQKIARGAFHKKPQQQRGSSVEYSKVNARISQLEARQPQGGGGFFGGFGSGEGSPQRQIGTGGWFDNVPQQKKKGKGGWFGF